MGVKYKVKENFFDTWSSEMAYVLGFLFSDGSLEYVPYIRGKYIRISSTDKDRILLVRSLLGSEHTIIKFKKSPRHKEQFLLRIGNMAIFDRLVLLGMTPKKSLVMRFPLVPEKFLSSFILGYFDGDGCVYIRGGKSKRPTHLKTIFTSGSRSFLLSLQKLLLQHAGIGGGGLYQHGSTTNAYQLRYTARDSMRLFLFMYRDKKAVSLALRRKYGIFMTYFTKLGIQTEDFPAILKKKGPVAK